MARAIRATPTERRHLANCAAATSMGIGLVVMCVALATLRNPGEIDPASGSVAYLVTIGFTAALVAYCDSSTSWPLRLVVAYWAITVAIVLGLQASQVSPVVLSVVLISLVAIGAVSSASAVAVWLQRRTTLPRPQIVASIPMLSPRENEVLAAVATGATNAGIAADLFLSERTVEQHLRSIFVKLDLGGHDSSNRRVRAATAWWRHQPRVNNEAGDSTG